MARLTFLEDLTPGDGVALRARGIGNGLLRLLIRFCRALNWRRRSDGLSFDYGVIGRLQTAQTKSIVKSDPTPADLKTYGLDKPAETVTLHLGSARASLVLGGKAEDNTISARDTSKPIVMTVESALADELKKGADEYRRKDIFEFRAYNATRIEFTRNGQTVAFEKVKPEGKDAAKNPQDKWRRISPKPADANKDTIDSLLSRLSNMRAASFVESTAKTGLDKPAMTITVKFDEGKKEEKVTFGQAGSDVFASRRTDPVLQQIEDFADATVSANDCFRPVSRYFDRLTRPEQLISSRHRALSVLTDPAQCGPRRGTRRRCAKPGWE